MTVRDDMRLEMKLKMEMECSTLASTSGTNMSADRKRVGVGGGVRGWVEVMGGHGVEVVFPLTDSL